MALLFIDGFDHVGTDYTIHLTKYGGGNGLSITTTTPRTGTARAIVSSGSSSIQSKTFSTSGAWISGVALRQENWAGTDSGPFLYVREGSTTHMRLELTTSRTLRVSRGDGTTLATGTTVLTLANWYYVEFKTVIHDSTGTYEVRIDGTTEVSGTGADTRNGGTGVWDNFQITGVGFGASQFSLDDLYVCDGSGTANNNFLGICRIEMLLPQIGNGSNTGLTPSTGTDHGALVDENPPNTTDYNSSPTVGLKDTYNYPSLTLTGTILGIQTNLYVNKSDAAARQVAAVVRAGGTDYDGANVSPSTTFSYHSEVRQTNPNTGVAWTASDITALEAGMKVTA